VAALGIAERATIANMAPEYGATCGFFALDAQSIAYLRMTRADATQADFVEAYARAHHLWRDASAPVPQYTRVIEVDLAQAELSVAGPRRPQDRMALNQVGADFRQRLTIPIAQGGFDVPAPPATLASAPITHGAVVLAAITSCTNTANPGVMLAAGLLARKALEKGMTPPAWMKRSLAPGSRAVTRYLDAAGLLAPLQALGFHVIGYGCTTCGGKSGPLTPEASRAIAEGNLVTAAVLSGNRNFEGRIHKSVRANYIASPAMVVAYALAGRIDIDFERDAQGQDVFLRDLWPAQEEIAALLPHAGRAALYQEIYASNALDNPLWQALDAPTGLHFPWDPQSHYLVQPPFFDVMADDALAALSVQLAHARVLAAFDDSLTTDHISPSGEIPVDTPAGQYLHAAGIAPQDFNTYVARRCNFHVMARATFANIRIQNALLPGIEGGWTCHFPDGARQTIFDAACAYQREGVASIILEDYGMGSSRDWAAKGSALLGVRAVIAESFERIHRANLVGMGVLPLTFLPGQGWRALGLSGSERFAFANVCAGILEDAPIVVTAQEGARAIRFEVKAQVLTQAERQLMAAGGMFAAVRQHFLGDAYAHVGPGTEER